MLELAFRCIEATRDYVIVCVKNKLKETNQPPCINLNIAVKSGQSKYEHDWICEIQMYLRSVLRIKTTSHVFYKVARANNEFAIKDIQENNEGGDVLPAPRKNFAKLSRSFSELQEKTSSSVHKKSMTALEHWGEIMTEAGAEATATSHPWDEDLTTAIEMHLFDGNDMTDEESAILKDALCKKGSDEASLNSWKKVSEGSRAGSVLSVFINTYVFYCSSTRSGKTASTPT